MARTLLSLSCGPLKWPASPMWLISGINAADFNDPRPGTVIAGRIEATT
jgi:hypothetical protein